MSCDVHPTNPYMFFRTVCSGPNGWSLENPPTHETKELVAKNSDKGESVCVWPLVSNCRTEAGWVAEAVDNLNQILSVLCNILA